MADGTPLRSRLYDHYVSRHVVTRGGDRAALTERLGLWSKHFAPLLPADLAADVLDIGCGYGEFLYFLTQRGYWRITGVEASEAQIALAEQLDVARYIHRGDILQFLSTHRESYSVITALDVLEHFAKPELLALLDLVRGALRPGGAFVVHVPNALAPVPIYAFDDLTHETYFTAASLRQVLEMSGFESIVVFPFTRLFGGFRGWLRWMRWVAGEALVRAYVASGVGVSEARSVVLTPTLAARCVRPRD